MGRREGGREQGLGGGGHGYGCSLETISVLQDERALEMDGGERSTTM